MTVGRLVFQPWAVGLALALACAPHPPGAERARTPGEQEGDGSEHANPARYRLAEAEGHWDRVGDDEVLEDLRPRYPELFAAVVTPGREVEREALALRSDLERQPADRRNFDALNALAIAYFEMNYRAEQGRSGEAGLSYLSLSFQSAKILAVPWRAYPLVSEGALRDAILDFFEDAGSGRKLGAAATAPRVAGIVASLEPKEADPARRARIEQIARTIMAAAEAAGEAQEAVPFR